MDRRENALYTLDSLLDDHIGGDDAGSTLIRNVQRRYERHRHVRVKCPQQGDGYNCIVYFFRVVAVELTGLDAITQQIENAFRAFGRFDAAQYRVDILFALKDDPSRLRVWP